MLEDYYEDGWDSSLVEEVGWGVMFFNRKFVPSVFELMAV